MTRPRSLGIGRTGALGYAVVDEKGIPIPAETRITTTGRDLAQLLATGTEIAILDAVEVMAPAMAASLRKAMDAGEAAGVKAGAQAGFEAGTRYGAKAGAVEGVKAGARYVLKNSRVHRSVVRDDQGRITGTIETREPDPQ